jgi:hypothetical protein
MIKKKLCVALRKYQGSDGKEKTQWLEIGHIHTSREGREYITMDPHINLAGLPQGNIEKGDQRVYVSLFDPDKDKYQGGGQRGQQRQQKDLNEPLDNDEDIPF